MKTLQFQVIFNEQSWKDFFREIIYNLPTETKRIPSISRKIQPIEKIYFLLKTRQIKFRKQKQ